MLLADSLAGLAGLFLHFALELPHLQVGEGQGEGKKDCKKALVLPYDEGIWRACLDVLEVIKGTVEEEVGMV